MWRATNRSRAANVCGRAFAGGFHRRLATRQGFMPNPMEFIQEVREEARKVTWPTRRETMITTAMVLVMVVIASIFFLTVDMVLQKAVALVLGFGRG
jgi:preprotein translocase subunit SecE